MQKKTQYIWLIILGAILITVLANIGLLNRFHKLSQLQELSAAREEEYWFIWRIGLVGMISELIILIVFIFYNYSWKDYFISHKFNTKQRLALIILSNLILLIGFIYLDFCINKYFTKEIADPVDIGGYLQNYFINHALVLIISIVTPYVLLRIEKIKAIELNLIKLKEEKIKAELAALKEQISPHFFFNTLSTLSTIVRNENEEAGLEFIQDISDTFRYTLTEAKADLVFLKQEIDFITSYLYLLQKRFGEKLQFEINISDLDRKKRIPPMSIQLLIENAIQHNVMTKLSPLKITITTQNDSICIINNLQEKEQVESFGLGLANLDNRYKLLSNKKIIIQRDDSNFMVQLPLL